MALLALAGCEASSHKAYAEKHHFISTESRDVVARHHREKADLAALNLLHTELLSEKIQGKHDMDQLKKQLEIMREEFSTCEVRLEQKYADHLSELSQTLDATVKEKAELEVKFTQMEQDVLPLKKKNKELEREFSTIKRVNATLERQVNEMTAEINFYKKTVGADSPELVALREQKDMFQEKAEKAEKAINQEIITRVEIESKYQTLVESMEFEKSVHNEHLRSALEFDITAIPYSNDLAIALRDMRTEYQQQLEAVKVSETARFESEIWKLQRELKLAKEEIARTKRPEIDVTKTDIYITMARRLREIEEEKIQWASKLTNLEFTIATLTSEKEQWQIQLAGYEHEIKCLCETTLTMAEEIGVYQVLLNAHKKKPETTISTWDTILMTFQKYGATDAEKYYYRGIFTSFDKDGDGFISTSELKDLFDSFDNKSFHGMARRNWTNEYCASLTPNNCGKLNFDEFLCLMIYEKKITLENVFSDTAVSAQVNEFGEKWLTGDQVETVLKKVGFTVSVDGSDLLNKFAHQIQNDGKFYFKEFMLNV